MDREQFVEIYTRIKTLYPNSEVMNTDEDMDVWFDNLQYFEFEDVSQAISNWRTKNKWAPTITELVKFSETAKSNRELDLIEQLSLRRNL